MHDIVLVQGMSILTFEYDGCPIIGCNVHIENPKDVLGALLDFFGNHNLSGKSAIIIFVDAQGREIHFVKNPNGTLSMLVRS